MGTLAKPILLATHDSNTVSMFRHYHQQCGILNPLEVFSDGEDVVRYLESDRLNHPLPVLLLLGVKMARMGGIGSPEAFEGHLSAGILHGPLD